jgi:methyl coenzyme M reductase alpha subunit
MLITLGRIWGRATASQQDQVWLKNFLHLVVMVRIAYSYSVTQEVIDKFRYHASSYLVGLRAYHPSAIKPSHHFVLHIADLMECFGSMRGWWAFPFERFNGQIQHLSTNHKPG